MHVHSRVPKVWNRRRIIVLAAALLVVAPLLLGAGAGAAAMNAVGLGVAALLLRRLSARKKTQRKEGVWRPCLRCDW